ncbi:hypothetical protein FOZ63_000124 [Perkinsus olseni]|uniref:Uncharacterized protein n=1 Tax=Perkinsus olseni TaxID=32597 RepID=A0A7J6TR51_PEROL|nr:hypothetical protein FOZ63_000124 [Perkinsus olseni]
MTPSKCSVVYTFRYLGLTHLLIYLARAAVWREKELLYARVDGRVNGLVEYIVIPHNTLDFASVKRTRSFVLEKGRARTRDPKPEMRNMCAYKHVSHIALADFNQVVAQARILRIQSGETSEYEADVVQSGLCFEQIRLRKTSGNTLDDSYASLYEGASPLVKEELAQICTEGFTALKPSSRLSNLEGIYTGYRMEKSIRLKFHDGMIKEADLVNEGFHREDPAVTYHPVCDGMMAVADVFPTTSLSKTIMILKRTKLATFSEPGESARRQIGRTLSRKKSSKGHKWSLGTQALCDMKQHGRRNISRTSLDQWDRDLPQEFILDPKVLDKSLS